MNCMSVGRTVKGVVIQYFGPGIMPNRYWRV